MKNVIVTACFGDALSTARITELSVGADVIAVAFDFGGVVSLSDLREAALAAGAARCHAIDVREDYARELVRAARYPDVPAGGDEAAARVARAVVVRTLGELAAFEHGTVVEPEYVPVPRRPEGAYLPAPVHLAIRFEGGMPVAVNGVEMTPAELIESLETITGESAVAVLHRHLQTAPGLQPA